MKICVVIPFYNHAAAIGAVVRDLKPFGLPCIIVNDGSDASCTPVLNALVAQEGNWLQVVEREVNGGKGAAVMTGCDAAYARGFTHVLQLDADGQHDTRDIPKAIDLAMRHPDALVSGYPVYDESVPAARRYGRYATHVWVWINTLSFAIRDSMCGFRVYPLAAARQVWLEHRMSRRMDFDIEIMVRMFWNGSDVVGFPTRVTYPQDGISHFDGLRDNLRISLIHARLFLGMLRRLPWLLVRTAGRRHRGAVA
jgi:glycosyltransferase involved in cell wall biosynthesis